MTAREDTRREVTPADLFLSEETSAATRPIRLIGEKAASADIAGLPPSERAWLEAVGFNGQVRRHVLVPSADGGVAGVVLGVGDGRTGEPCGPAALLVGALPQVLPGGAYHLAGEVAEPELAAVAWGLGAYRFRRYKSAPPEDVARLRLPAGVDRAAVCNTVEAAWLGRDLINTPANDMGPAELETAVRSLAARHKGEAGAIVGEDLVTQNFPMINAVGRASPRAPRLIDLTWGRQGAPRVTLVGKGICFDTGGLDIKPPASMLLMKKDMGGAAAALTLAHMIMGRGLDVRLRVLVAAADNSISGNAYRPGDVLGARAGKTVEIGNTDAEGRLVLADALALASAEAPDLLIAFATLTGAARVALGPELPALFTDDDALARDLQAAGERLGDPVWRMPFWTGYERMLDSEVADMGNVSETPFAGSVIAALFLRRFVDPPCRFVHVDIYGWRTAARALGPKGGEPQAARALFAVIEDFAGRRRTTQ